MGWYHADLWVKVLLAFALGALFSYLMWGFRYKKKRITQEDEVSRLRRNALDRENEAGVANRQLVDLRTENSRRLDELKVQKVDADKLKLELEHSQKASADLTAERDALTRQVVVIRRERESAERDLAVARARVTDLDKQLVDVRGARHQLESDLNELRTKHSESERAVIDLRSQQTDLERELVAVRSTALSVTTLESQLEVRSRELNIVRSNVTRLTDEGARLTRSLDAARAEAQQAAVRASAALDESRRARYRAETEVARLQNELRLVRSAPPAARVETRSGAQVSAATDGSRLFAVGDAPTRRDDLKRVEGIGPKMEKALHAAGVLTFEQLASADVETLKAAIETNGLKFAPSVATWAHQASFLARGDEAGFKAYTDHLTAGREPGQD